MRLTAAIMTDAVGRLRATANGQHGAFSIEQARSAGIPARVLRGWVKSGLLDATGVRTFRSALQPPDPFTDLAGLIRDVRPKTWISHETAGAIIGFETLDIQLPYDLTVRRGDLFRRPGVRLHTATVLEPADVTMRHGLPITSPIRTLIDLAPRLGNKRLTQILDGALRDRLFTETALIERIARLRSQGKYALPRLLAVIDGAEPSRGGHSWLERRYLELAAARGLPRPTVQAVVGRVDGRTIRVDCRYPGTPVVVELLGYRWHRTRAQLQRDTDRMNQMILDGLVPFQFTYDHITLAPDSSIDLVVEALRRSV